MARAGYANVVADSFGNRVAGAAVEVRQPGTATPLAVPLYQAPTGAAALANPLTTDGQGFFSFYLDVAQTVDLYVAASGYGAHTEAGVAVAVGGPVLDGAQLVAGSVTTAQIADGTLTDADVASANKDGAAATPSLRTLGTGAQQAAAGNHGHAASVSSVALTLPSEFSVSGSPITTSGTLAVSKANQSANQVYAGPASGGAAAPGFRALGLSDLPAITQVGYAAGATAGPTTTSTSNADMPDMSVTLTTAGGDLLVFFYAMWSINAANVQARFYFQLDGGAEQLIGLPHEVSADYQLPIFGVTRYTGLSAASHTVKVRWSTVSNTLTARDTSRALLVVEVRK
ncbi:MAG TPA: carboxypeptidase-like regulatory domain-containing protein [Chloroflexota bacterium]|nr:carboxypeptidase-like regulatory domain-containing protein [Chloroflexota bacterium]